MSDDRQDEPFLSRWSRQKRNAVVPALEPVASEEVEPEFDLTQLPKVEDLTADSDITGFLRKGVPEALQRLALRRMWALDSKIRDFIEIAENQWDFNAAGGVPGVFQELAPGTDVGIWLAQASQSVVTETAASRPVAAGENVSIAASKNAAAQHSTASANLSSVEPDERVKAAAPVDPMPDEICESLTYAPADMGVAPPPDSAPMPKTSARRRRHGGAMPQ